MGADENTVKRYLPSNDVFTSTMIQVCIVCGSVIFDREVHFNWHETNEAK